jgi:hypothetical protein
MARKCRPRLSQKSVQHVSSECKFGFTPAHASYIDDYGSGSVCSMKHALLRMNSVVQNDVEERLMNPDATVVFNKAELAKAIHKEADTGPGGSNHLRQGFLGNRRYQ